MENGATIGDALIRLIDFAQSHPLVFLGVTMPLLTIALLVSFFVFRIFSDPVGQRRAEFDGTRETVNRLLNRNLGKSWTTLP
jgi:hypothetical protein